MNIKEHIEARHYPTDKDGRALVTTNDGRKVRIYTINNGVHMPIVGAFTAQWSDDETDENIARWSADGSNPGISGHVALLPPPPRKVKVTAWGIFGKTANNAIEIKRTLDAAQIYQREHIGEAVSRIIQLTGEYEEPWR